MSNAVQKHLTSELRAIHQDVMAGMDTIKTRITEQLFVQQYLPLIHGAGRDSNINLDPWFSLVGGIFNTAYVVDNHGNVLYETPSLYPKNEFITQGDLRTALLNADKVSHARLNAREQMVDQYFGAKGGLKISQPANTFKEWNALFRKYGLEERSSDILNIGHKNAPVNQPQGDVDELFDYD